MIRTLCFFLVPFFSFSQKISVLPNQAIPIQPQRISSESYLSVNPVDPEHLLGCYLSAKISDQGYDYYTEVILSKDGGETWEELEMDILQEAADPWCQINDDGSLLISDISSGSQFHLTTRFSLDGDTWMPVNSHGYARDHSILYNTADKKTLLVSTQKENSINSIIVNQSEDNGRKFSQLSKTSPFPNVAINAKTPVELSSGLLILPFIVRYRSNDNGDEVPISPTQSWFISSQDGGKTFSQPYFITGISGNRHHYLAVNTNRRFKDELYYFFSGANDKGAFITKSRDAGITWSEPMQLDVSQSSRITPGAFRVSKKGEIGLIWSEKTNDRCFQWMFSFSRDGGVSFTTPISIQDTLSCPNQSNDWVSRAWPQGGDYCGLVATPDGFAALWSDARTGKFKPYFTKISIK